MTKWVFPIDKAVTSRIIARERASAALSRVPRLMGGFRRVSGLLEKQADRIERYRNDEAYRAGQKPAGYSGLKEEMTFFTYKSEVASSKFAKLRTPSYRLYQEQESVLDEILSRPDASPFVNFGVSYAYIDAMMARRFPAVQFIGVDRSPYTKALNEVDFSDVTNLRFEASDIRDALATIEGGTFFHSRTMTLLQRDDVQQIYQTASDRGMRYIVGFEMLGLPRETLQPYEFSLSDRASVHYRHFMFIHNYPHLLDSCGFELERFYVISTNSPHQDQNILCFVARKH